MKTIHMIFVCLARCTSHGDSTREVISSGIEHQRKTFALVALALSSHSGGATLVVGKAVGGWSVGSVAPNASERSMFLIWVMLSYLHSCLGMTGWL